MISFGLASSTLGGIAISADQEFALLVGGRSYGTWLEGSIKISDSIGSRSTCKFTLSDPTGTLHLTVGTSVFVVFHGIYLFGGTIDNVQEQNPINSAVLMIDVSAVDFSALADRHVVAAEYTNQTLQQIVTDIVNVKTRLWEDGVTVGEVQVGPTITRATFNYRTANQCFRDLADLSGMAWNINPNRSLQFFDKATYTAPFTIGEGAGASLKYSDLKFTRDRGQYRNKQILRAGLEKTDTKIVRFVGDDTALPQENRRRTFVVDFEVADTPTVKKNGTIQRLGIRGKDKDGDMTFPSATTWPQWFYAIGEKEISQNNAEDSANNPTLSASDTLEVTYVGQFPMVIDSDLEAEQSAVKAVEGGSGIYVHVDEDQDIDGHDFASEKTDRLLTLFGRIPRELGYHTDLTQIRAGHLQKITSAIHGISAVEFLVDSVRTTVLTADGVIKLRSTVRALDGEKDQGWSDFFRRLAEAGRKFTIRENETIHLVRQFKETLTFTDTITDPVQTGDQTGAYTNDPYTWAIFGTVTIGGTGEIVGMFAWGRSRFGMPHGA